MGQGYISEVELTELSEGWSVRRQSTVSPRSLVLATRWRMVPLTEKGLKEIIQTFVLVTLRL